MTDLKPCPFCGSEAKLLGGPMAQETYSVYCTKYPQHNISGTMNEAQTIEWWNTRAPITPDQQQWISIKDRLPSESERLKESIVLVADNCGNTNIAFLHRPRINDSGPVFLDEYRGIGLSNVRYWMPLPKAPELTEE